MIRFSVNVYPARGHAIGFGGNGENRGGGAARSVCVDEVEDRRLIHQVKESERSKFIDEVLEKIRRRKMVEVQPEARREAA